MGRRVKTTPDHPFVVAERPGGPARVELAAELTPDDWLPVAQNTPSFDSRVPEALTTVRGIAAAGLTEREVIVKARRSEIDAIGRDSRPRSGTLRLTIHVARASGSTTWREAAPCASTSYWRCGSRSRGRRLAPLRNGTYVPVSWRQTSASGAIVGLYIAEGHCTVDGRRHRLTGPSTRPTRRSSSTRWPLLEGLGVKAERYEGTPPSAVTLFLHACLPLVADVLGLGINCYEKRIPNLAWVASRGAKRALLAASGWGWLLVLCRKGAQRRPGVRDGQQ